jgi:hypothetical protein
MTHLGEKPFDNILWSAAIYRRFVLKSTCRFANIFNTTHRKSTNRFQQKRGDEPSATSKNLLKVCVR